MSLYGLMQGRGANGFGYNSTAEQVTEGQDLSGKTYLVTGCNSGLGLETLRVLRLRGASLVGAARSLTKAEAVATELGGDFLPLACDLAEPDSVRAALRKLSESGLVLDGIIANAGIMALPKRSVRHGLELQFLTNHVGHFILITGLLDQLSKEGRVVIVSSTAHTGTYKEGLRLDDLDAAKGYSAFAAYAQSKLANLLFARALAERLPTGQSAYAIHPGVIATNIGRHLPMALNAAFKVLGPIFATKSVAQGAATQVYVATHPEAAAINGEYWADCNVKRSSDFGQDADLARALWQKTEMLVAQF